MGPWIKGSQSLSVTLCDLERREGLGFAADLRWVELAGGICGEQVGEGGAFSDAIIGG